jgi:TRAP-type C4-dicarboxylate transport system permease large subunit
VAISEIAFLLGGFIEAFKVSPIAVILFIVILYIILGCFLPAFLTLILTIPIFYPVILAVGFDPIWYGVIMVRTIEIGGLTPPLGIDCFVLSGVSGIPLGTIYRGVIPFVISDLIHVALLIAVPALSLFLPNTM